MKKLVIEKHPTEELWFVTIEITILLFWKTKLPPLPYMNKDELSDFVLNFILDNPGELVKILWKVG